MNLIDTIYVYFNLGFTHVLPLGLDHILFLLSIYFLNSSLKSVLIQCSIFTFAHSISLGLSASGYISPYSSIVEPLIALSILFTSIGNILRSHNNPYRMGIIFIFGIIHGIGFASSLKKTGIPSSEFFSALFSFNIGVEVGQISILFLAHLLIGKWFSNKPWYQERIVYPFSCIISCLALYWTFERILT